MSKYCSEIAWWASNGRRIVHEYDTKQLLECVGIPVPRRNPRKGYCVVKLSSDSFPHKTDHDLVQLNIPVELASRVGEDLQRYDPGGKILIEEFVDDGVLECVVGCRHDPTFGPIVVVGLGGILVELLDTVCVRLAPVDNETARTVVLRNAQTAALLKGVRGKFAGDIDALCDVLVRLSQFFVENATLIEEIEINPIVIRPEGQGVVALDALMILKS